MTMKLFIAFLSILFEYCNMNCKCSPLPPLFFSFVAPVSSCKQKKNDTERKRRGERMWQAIDTLPPHKLWFFTVLYACSVSFILDLHGCFWIITGYELAFLFSACLNFKVNLLFVLLLLFKVKQQNKSIANSLVQVSKLSISVWQCAYKVSFNVAVHLQARKPSINPQLRWPLL